MPLPVGAAALYPRRMTDTIALITRYYTAFNAGDTATGSWIQQTVTTTPNLWYMLSWDESNPGGAIPQRARTDVNVWDGNAPSGSGDLLSIRTRYPRTGRAQLFRATSDVTTLRFGDMGSNSTSNDGGLSSISLTPSALHGKVNIAPLFGTATASSTHGSFGIDPIFAIDNQSDFGVSHYTTYHSANNGSNAWWTLTYHEPVTLTEIEIQARTGFDDRNGDFLELYDSGGGLIDSLLIEDDSLWGVAGKWHDVASLTIRNSASNSVALNLGEVRTYAVFNNGMFVIPEPGTWTLFAMSLLAAR